jgi:predicted acetyltransferase
MTTYSTTVDNNTIDLVLVDKNSQVDLFMIKDMIDKFVSDYDASADIANKKTISTYQSIAKDLAHYDRYYFIKFNNEFAGFIALEAIKCSKTHAITNYNSDEIFVLEKFRSQNIATIARELMRVSKNNAYTFMIGSNISYRRARRLADYYKQQNYKYIYFKTNSTSTTDDSMCLLAYDKIIDKKLFPLYPVCLPLSKMNVDRLFRKVNKMIRKYK